MHGVPTTLSDFEKSRFTTASRTHDVYRIGSGPAVIVIHEIPGITPLVAAFGRRVAGEGFSAVLPDRFGVAGAPITGTRIVSAALRACLSREFVTIVRAKTSPVASYFTSLSAGEHARCGGPGVGAVGMCLTGGLALAMAVDSVMLAPVMSQPTTPFPVGEAHRGDLGISPADLETVRTRTVDGLCLMGLRFTRDKASPPERFGRLRDEFGENFIAVEIDPSARNSWGYRQAAHSVLTEDYVDDAPSPIRAALAQVLEFLRSRLLVGA